MHVSLKSLLEAVAQAQHAEEEIYNDTKHKSDSNMDPEACGKQKSAFEDQAIAVRRIAHEQGKEDDHFLEFADSCSNINGSPRQENIPDAFKKKNFDESALLKPPESFTNGTLHAPSLACVAF